MNREDMIAAVKWIIENNSKDSKIGAVKIYDFWAISPSYAIRDGKPTHKDTGEVYK